MMAYLELGPVPAEEEVAQVGADDYGVQSFKECKAYKSQLHRVFGGVVRFSIKKFDHDFGSYKEVVVLYDESDEAEVHRAFDIKNNCPSRWDDQARRELGIL